MKKILEVYQLKKNYTKQKKIFSALDNVSFHLHFNECLGIVGESGSGKSTLAKIIAGLEKQNSGNIFYNGESKKNDFSVQMIFQSAVNSFNPKLKLETSLLEVLLAKGIQKHEALNEIVCLLETCGLSVEDLKKYPHQLSGGECQRLAIIRALSVNPDIVICDEITGSLDEKHAQQVMVLLKTLKAKHVLSYLFISHDIYKIKQMCSRVIVMYNGKIVEEGATNEIFGNPRHSYTKRLIDSLLT